MVYKQRLKARAKLHGQSSEPDDESLDIPAFAVTYLFSVLPSPDSIRALSLHIVYQENQNTLQTMPHLIEEYNKLVGPIHRMLDEKPEQFMELYKRKNPNTSSIFDIEEQIQSNRNWDSLEDEVQETVDFGLKEAPKQKKQPEKNKWVMSFLLILGVFVIIGVITDSFNKDADQAKSPSSQHVEKTTKDEAGKGELINQFSDELEGEIDKESKRRQVLEELTVAVKEKQTFQDSGDVRNFIDKYLAALNRGTIPDILALYDDSVDYFQSGTVTRSFIRRDKEEYYQRWSTVNNSLNGEITIWDSDDKGTKIVKFPISFDVYSPKQSWGVTGTAEITLKLRQINGDIKIIDEKQKVLSRNKY